MRRTLVGTLVAGMLFLVRMTLLAIGLVLQRLLGDAAPRTAHA